MGGEHPASPIPTPTLATSNIPKLLAVDVNTVMTLHMTIASETIFFLTPTSAHLAMGIPAKV